MRYIQRESMPSPAALFITNNNSLNGRSGGQQICTQEYINVLRAAGFSISVIGYELDRRLHVRVKRKIWPRPYRYQLMPSLINRITDEVESNNIEYIFLNVVDAAPLAIPIRQQFGSDCRIVLLSHGLASVDYLHELRARRHGTSFASTTTVDLKTLSRQLFEEVRQRQVIDHVFCLAPFEVEIERWLGAKSVSWLPRTIPVRTLEWKPAASRLGFVGTIDHPPNREGLILFLEELQQIASKNVRLRLVGSPRRMAESIARRFPLVDYLGPLSDEELEQEASTWNCFVHPIFCYARGCSTKLAIALGWGIPIVTTNAGCRGYTWRQGRLPLADTPASLAKLAVEMLSTDVASSVSKEIRQISLSAPSTVDIASLVCSALAIPFPTTRASITND